MPYYPPLPNKQSSDHPPRKQLFLRRMILCTSVLLILYGVVQLFLYTADWISSRHTTQELREIAGETDITETSASGSRTEQPEYEATASPSASIPHSEEMQILSDELPVTAYPNGYNLVPRIQKLRKKNRYIIGWIKMDNLDEPVAQKDNSFFLNHDATGKHNSNGAIFMDQGISLLTRPYTILLYGHNMKSGAMFGNLRKYEKYSYCYQHRVFRFDTLYEEGQYVIFAVETISVTPGTSRYVSLTDLQSSDRGIRKKALKELKDHSLYDTLLDANEEDQILLLITCVGNDDERLMIAARRLREGETADKLTME